MADRRNPWVSHDVEEETPRETVEPTVSPATGPLAPQPGVASPPAGERLPIGQVPAGSALYVVGVHGGAGESSIAALDETWRAAGHVWPAQGTVAVPVLLVARSSARGLLAAQAAARQWASGGVSGVDLVGLVIVADAPGRPPRALRDLARVVGGGVPRVWHVPWIEAWRLGETPTISHEHQLGALTRDLRTLVAQHAEHRRNDA